MSVPTNKLQSVQSACKKCYLLPVCKFSVYIEKRWVVLKINICWQLYSYAINLFNLFRIVSLNQFESIWIFLNNKYPNWQMDKIDNYSWNDATFPLVPFIILQFYHETDVTKIQKCKNKMLINLKK